jgi:ribosome modulation factor
MRHRRTPGEEAYMEGFFAAIDKGYAAGLDPKFAERDNPYKRFEHKKNWLDGFRKARAQAKQEPTP